MIAFFSWFSPRRSVVISTALLVVSLTAAGCGHHHTASLPRQQTAPVYAGNTRPVQRPNQTRIPITPTPPGGVSDEDFDFINTHRPIVSEQGIASWYTAPYKGRKAANGQVFDDNAMTAAHRTLPMGSLIVVTNLKTSQTAAMRITDRGPFIDGRILDMSSASAKATGIYRAGLAQIRIDVYQTPKPIETGGRWCVQFGAFTSERPALKLKERLLKKYPDAKVIEFPGDKSFWVRIRPQGDNREQAEYIAERVKTGDATAEAFLTRLD